MPLTDGLQVTLLNIETHAPVNPISRRSGGRRPGHATVCGSSVSYCLLEFDYSACGGFTNQQRMATEVRRIGPQDHVRYSILYFPVDPHFVFPYFQFLPIGLRVWLVQHFPMVWHARPPNPGRRTEVTAIRLLNGNKSRSSSRRRRSFKRSIAAWSSRLWPTPLKQASLSPARAGDWPLPAIGSSHDGFQMEAAIGGVPARASGDDDLVARLDRLGRAAPAA